jgi:hypothetical protein
MCSLFSKMNGLIIIFFLIAVVGCRSAREGAPPTFADSKSAAEQFRKFITQNNRYKKLGFDSVEEAVGADLGAPLAIFFVRLDRLREYQPGSDSNTLLSDSAQVYYPVLDTKKQIRAAVIVEMADGKWKMASLGNAGLAKQIAQVQKRAAAPSGGASAPDIIVQVPALGIYFIGRRDADKKLILIPIANDPRYNLRAAAEQPADEVFAKLVPFAKRHNGLAPG